MLLSLILAWVAVLCAVMTALKFVARVSGNRALNAFFHKCHIPFGVLLLVVGLIHGILAGNPSWATLADFQPAAVLFTLNWGTACLVLAALLGLTYLLRRVLKRRWMIAHRVLTVLLLVVLGLHLLDMGIQLPSRLFGTTGTEQTATVTDSATASGSSSTTTTPSTGSSSATTTTPSTGSSSATTTPSTGSSSTTTTPSTGSSSTTTTPSTGSSSTTTTTPSTGSSSTTTTTPSTGSSSSSSGTALVTFSGAQLADGTYEGSADGYSGTTTVSVTVSGGQVTDITVVSESDSPQFFSRAESILDTIVSGQSLEVDTVSGATFSSAGLLNAVYDALQSAVTSGTLQVTQVDLSNVRRGH